MGEAPLRPGLATADSPDTPVLFLLHFLGGSAREWDGVVDRLQDVLACRRIDLPGFGDAAGLDTHTVDAMVGHVAAIIGAAAPRRWLLAGHSMGAKVAAIVARRAESGDAALSGLMRLVLLAGSPPAPEPMDEDRRQTMLTWFQGDEAETLAQARGFIGQNVGAPLHPLAHDRAVDDVIRMNPAAWRAWLDSGSREDWSAHVGLLQTPALIVAGERDGDLGPEAQLRTMAPHFAHCEIVTLAGAGHLLPLERPDEVAQLILAQVDDHLATPPDDLLDPAYRAIIASDRVSARTRAVLLARAAPDDPARPPAALTNRRLATLRAVVDRVLPQRTSPAIDLAARIDEALASGPGDGWRFAILPPDRQAYAAALDTLDGAANASHRCDFVALDAASRDEMLKRVADRLIGDGHGALSAEQMGLWFEDLRADAVKAYVAHPATLARIGYGGIANGGDGPRKQGFALTGADQPEGWEPRGPAGAAA